MTTADLENVDLAGQASAALEAVLGEAPKDGVTMDWLLAHLLTRSPEFLFLAVTPVAILPATSPFAGALLLVAALPLVFHRRAFALPGFLAARQIPAARLARAVRTMQVILKRYEASPSPIPIPLPAIVPGWRAFWSARWRRRCWCLCLSAMSFPASPSARWHWHRWKRMAGCFSWPCF